MTIDSNSYGLGEGGTFAQRVEPVVKDASGVPIFGAAWHTAAETALLDDKTYNELFFEHLPTGCNTDATSISQNDGFAYDTEM